MSELRLTGLDGKNPLAFLAALGVLNGLADRVKEGQPAPKLVWRSEGTFVPVIVDGPSREALLVGTIVAFFGLLVSFWLPGGRDVETGKSAAHRSHETNP